MFVVFLFVLTPSQGCALDAASSDLQSARADAQVALRKRAAEVMRGTFLPPYRLNTWY